MKQAGARSQSGAVVVMVTVGIMVLLGVMGLAVDLGWSYYSRRAAQVAADAAAQAGARRALELGNAAQSFSGLGADNSDVLEQARAYAESNGFTDGGAGGRQTVQLKAGYPPYPGIEKLHVIYWVQARVTSRWSSLFPMAGGGTIESGATAVAAVLLRPSEGSVFLLNQSCDPTGADCTGANLDPMDPAQPGQNLGVGFSAGGNSRITAPGGVFFNSSAYGPGDARTGGHYAMETNNLNSGITAPFVQFAQDGNYKGAPNQNIPYVNGPQGSDPTMNMNFGNQPRVKTVAELVAETGGVVRGVTADLDGATLGPGVYVRGAYSMNKLGVPQFTFSNAPVHLSNVTFNSGGKPGTYIFLGGISLDSGSATFDQGVYVLAGVSPLAPTTNILSMDKSTAIDGGGGKYGEMFLLTRPDYQADASSPILLGPNATFLVQPIGVNGGALPGAPATTLFTTVAGWGFGDASIKSGKGNANIDLTGLKGRDPCLPGDCATGDPELFLYEPALLWQDRRNSGLPSSKILADANAFGGLKGMIYQPRRSLIDMQGNGNKAQPTAVITGAIRMGGGPDLNLSIPPLRISETVVSLVR